MFFYVIVGVILIRIILTLIGKIDLTTCTFNTRRKTRYVPGLFQNNYIDTKVLFSRRYDVVPSIAVITEIDATKAYALIIKSFDNNITRMHQASMFDHNAASLYFSMTIFELRKKRMIELGNGYAEVFYTKAHRDWAHALIKDLAECKIESDITTVKTPTIVGFARAMEMN
ncbi:MAG: hypothetical protein JWQ40_4009 [Segetibacter sp.]|nr:hypothetical protein [Segetibacter sp.]